MKSFLGGVVFAVVLLFVAGTVTGGDPPSEPTHGTTSTTSQAPRVEVREKVVREGVSQDCKDEIAWTKKVAATTRKLNLATNGQTAIIDQSFQAIIMKDWKALNVEKQNQINLSNDADILKAQLVEELDRLSDVEGSCK